MHLLPQSQHVGQETPALWSVQQLFILYLLCIYYVFIVYLLLFIVYLLCSPSLLKSGYTYLVCWQNSSTTKFQEMARQSCLEMDLAAMHSDQASHAVALAVAHSTLDVCCRYV